MQKAGRILVRSIALAVTIVMLATMTIFATPIKDVSSSHWAYNEITEMQKRGLLLTSSQGEFFPNNYVTYFELSEILAKATGYQDASINPDMDPALKKVIDTNYQKQKPIIEAHQKNYKYWQKDANEEIAYLLGKGYLAKEDLGKFMSKSTEGVESKRGVRKQEAAVFLVRILHKAETAKGEYSSTGFADEEKIEPAYRPYVAYMKKLGIINGNESGEFSPTEPITRATLSKMLVDTLKIKETPPAPEKPVNPASTPTEPSLPKDKALEGKFTKMISKGDESYYIVLEVEPDKPPYTYTIEPTATVIDKDGLPISLEELKNKIDTKSNGSVIVASQIEVIGTTEYVTRVKIMDGTTNYVPPVIETPENEEYVRPERPGKNDVESEEAYNGRVRGTIHSILIAPSSEIAIKINNKTQKTFKMDLATKIYSQPRRREVAIWDLRLNQEIDAIVIDGEVSTLDITKAAPPITLTGTVEKVSINGDTLEVRIPYDTTTQQTNRLRTINVPMATRIIEGTSERGRKDLEENMEIVIVYGQDEEVIPEKIIIISK